MVKRIPASDVSYEVVNFLSELNSRKHAVREKSMKAFLKKMKIQGDEIYDDDVDIALIGKDGIIGLLAWAGEKSKNHGTALKRSCGPAMSTLHSLITMQMGGGLQDQNIWLSRLRCVHIEHLHCMSLENHLLCETRKGGHQRTDRGEMRKACTIIQLLLESHFNAETGDPENLSLQDLVHSKQAQDIFINEISSGKLLVQASPNKDSPASSPWPSPVSEGGISSNVATRSSFAEAGTPGTCSPNIRSPGHPQSSAHEKDRLIPEENVPMSDDDPHTKPLRLDSAHSAEFLLENLDRLKHSSIEEYDKSLSSFCMDDPLGLHPSFRVGNSQEALGTGFVPTGDEDRSPPFHPAGGDDLSHSGNGNGEKEMSKQRLREKVFYYLQSKSKFVQNGFSGKSPERNAPTDRASRPDSPSKLTKVFSQAAEPTEQCKQQQLDSMGSIFLTEKEFQPEIFMYTVHADSGLADLTEGLETVEKAKEKRVDQVNELVKKNLSKFVRCSACIEMYTDQVRKVMCPASCKDLKPKPRVLSASVDDGNDANLAFRPSTSMSTLEGWNQTKAKNSLVYELSSLLDLAQFEADSKFSDLLGKLDEIKEVRAAQSLLESKRELLSIPSKMKAYVESDKYEESIQLYNFVHETSLGRIELKVRQETDEIAQAAHSKLLSILESDSASIDDQLSAVGFLSMLGYANGDPVLPLSICLDDQTEHFARSINDVCAVYYGNLENAYEAFNLASGFNRLVNVKSPADNSVDAAVRRTLKLGSPTSDPTVVGNVSGQPRLPLNLSPALNSSEDLSAFRNVNGLMSSLTSPVRSQVGHQPVLVDAAHGTEGFPASSSSQYDVDSSTSMLNIARLKHIENICECLSSWIPHLAELCSHLMSHEVTIRGTQSMMEYGESDEFLSSRILKLDHQRTIVFDKWLCGSAQDVLKTVLGTAEVFLDDKYRSIFTTEEYVSASGKLVRDHSPASVAFVDRCLSSRMDKEHMRQVLQSLAGLTRTLNTYVESASGTSLLLDMGVSNFKAAVLKIQEVYIRHVSDKLWDDACNMNCDAIEKRVSRNMPSHPPSDLRQSKAFETIIIQELTDLAALLPLPEASGEQVSNAVSNALDGMLCGMMKHVSSKVQDCSFDTDMDNDSTAFTVPAPIPDPMDHMGELFRCLAECLYMEQEGMPKLRSLFKNQFIPTVALEDISNRDNEAFAEKKDAILKHYMRHLHSALQKYVYEAWWGHPSTNISTGLANNAAATQEQQQSTTLAKTGGETAIAVPPIPSYLVKALLMLVNIRSNASIYLGKWLFQTMPPATTSNVEQEKTNQPPPTYKVLYSDYIIRESIRLIMNIVCNCANKRIMGSEDIGIRPLDGTNIGDIASRVAQVEFLCETLWRYIPSDTVERISRSLQRLCRVIHDSANDDTIQDNELLSKLKLMDTTKVSKKSIHIFSDVLQQMLSPEKLANVLTVSKLQDSLRLYVCALR